MIFDETTGWHILRREDKFLPGDFNSVKDLRLRLENSRFSDYDAFLNLPNLVGLDIFPYRANTFQPLQELTRLDWLSVCDFRHVRDLSPLANLTSLKTLDLSCLITWLLSRKTITVDTFAPLASLKHLEILSLTGVRPERDGTTPLLHLSHLHSLSFGDHYPLHERAQLIAKLKCLRTPFMPTPYFEDSSHCRKCSAAKVFLFGSDIPKPKTICPRCHHERFAAHLAAFDRVIQNANIA